MKKKILIIEPFFSGSHASWAKQLQQYSSHEIDFLTMTGKFWKWRMYGGAITLAQEFLKLDKDYDMLLATDMLDLTTFLSLVRKRLKPTTKVCVYFHENQLAYPWKEDGEDKKAGRDINYGFMNYTTALTADYVFFNSKHNRDSFYGELRQLLKRMPDYRHSDAIDELYAKSIILPIGIPLKNMDKGDAIIYKEDAPLILWNHRWEFDKNPDDFFKALFILQDEGLDFRVAMLGEAYKNAPPIIEEAKVRLKERIAKSGFLSGNEYASWMLASDIMPVTSHHDFFGISVMEGVYSGAFPLLPKRLTYPDLYHSTENPEIFYDNFNDLVAKLRHAIIDINKTREANYASLAKPYDWDCLIDFYDGVLSDPGKYQ